MELLTSPFGSVAHSLAMTVRAAKENGEHEIFIPNGTYHVYADECATPVVCVSNHGYNGFKNAALAIEDASDITVDANGSTFILHGMMDFAIISRSQNITLRNLSVRCADSCNFQGKVTDVDDGCVTVELEEHPALTVFGDRIFQKFNDNQYEAMGRTLDYVTDTRELRCGSGDNNFGAPLHKLRKTLDGNTLKIYDAPVPPCLGDTIVFTMSRRCNQAFLTSHSKNVLLENITVGTCWGMAFIAQKCENVTVRACTVTPDEGRCWSAGQDATHFVNCRGRVIIENSLFENQLDDAVNLHGIYTVISKRAGNTILVKYGHYQSTGVDIYSAGDRIQVLDRESQQPLGSATVSSVEVLNGIYTSLGLSDIEGEIADGMIVENLSDEADAFIRNNVIRNNRARGMLIAVKGHIEITKNHFHSGGAAIQFESDPLRWLECGSVADVTISDNFFDDCRHGKWSRAVIDINKRKKTVEGFYYHDTIRVVNNRFTQTSVPCVCADNVKNLVFEGNEYVCPSPVVAEHCFVNGELFGDSDV